MEAKEEAHRCMLGFAQIWQKVMEEELEAIEQAANLVVKSFQKQGNFYLFGTGHSHLIAEEVYARAGGLANVKAILPTEIMLHERPLKSTMIERLSGYAAGLLTLYDLNEKDTLLVISNSGRNNVPVEMCLEAKKRGANVIVLTSLAHSMQVSSRHSSGKCLFELADVVLDNHAPQGDATYQMENLPEKLGPISDFTGIGLVQALVVAIANLMQAAEMPVPIFESSNLDGADEKNRQLFAEYFLKEKVSCRLSNRLTPKS